MDPAGRARGGKLRLRVLRVPTTFRFSEHTSFEPASACPASTSTSRSVPVRHPETVEPSDLDCVGFLRSFFASYETNCPSQSPAAVQWLCPKQSAYDVGVEHGVLPGVRAALPAPPTTLRPGLHAVAAGAQLTAVNALAGLGQALHAHRRRLVDRLRVTGRPRRAAGRPQRRPRRLPV